MARYIDADLLKESILGWTPNLDDWQIEYFIDTEPTADVVEVKQGMYNRHEVACIIADLLGDDCACNFNNNDEWLPNYCDFAEKECPNPCGVACWEQYLKHLDKAKMKGGDE